MQKYRADTATVQPDDATVWYAEWVGGPTLAKITNCRLVDLAGDMRRTVYITGEPDSWWTIPAICKIQGRRVRGYVSRDEDGDFVFRHCYY